MPSQFSPIASVEAWQLSNPPIFQLASLRASLEIFDQATMPALAKRSKNLTQFLFWLLQKNLKNEIEILTPIDQGGAMLSLRFKSSPKEISQKLMKLGIVVDFREPDIIRITPAPLYNSYEDVYCLVHKLKEFCTEMKK